MHFREWKYTNFAWDFIKINCLGSNSEYPSIGSDSGLAPTRWQAIIWTHDGLFTDVYMRHSALLS